jgi:hypothetical protein
VGGLPVWLQQVWTSQDATLISALKTSPKEEWHLLDVPQAIKDAGLNVAVVDGNLVYTVVAGVSSEVLATGFLERMDDGDEIRLPCSMDKKAWNDEASLRLKAQFIVVELHAKTVDKTVRFALRQKPRDTVCLGWADEARLTLLNTWELKRKYPWPTLLHIKQADDKDMSGPIEVLLNNVKTSLDVKFERQHEMIRIVLSCPELDKRLEDWSAGLAKLKRKLDDEKKTERDMTEKLGKAKGDEKNRLAMAIGRAQEAQKQTAKDRHDIVAKAQEASRQLKLIKPIVVYDPWDLPIAEVVLELVAPSDSGAGGSK